MLISLYDANNVYIGHIDRLTTTLLNGSQVWNIPKAIYGYGGDIASCITVDGQQYCGISPRQIISGSYKIRITYFTPSNACFGFCPQVSGQQTLGTYESGLFYINSTSLNNIPTISSFTSSASSITSGQSIMLSWVSNNANSCTLTPSTGSSQSLATSGTLYVYPTTTTTYNLTCTNSYGTSSTSTQTVYVNGGNTTQNYYDSGLGAQVNISGRTLTLSFSGTSSACYAGTVNFGDGTSAAYSPSGTNCTANVVKTYTNAGQYQIIKTVNGSMLGTAYISIQ
jgi:hypothetical protein